MPLTDTTIRVACDRVKRSSIDVNRLNVARYYVEVFSCIGLVTR